MPENDEAPVQDLPGTPPPGPQPLGSIAYAVIAFLSLVVTLLIAYGLYLASQNAVASPVLRSFYYLLLWVLGITSALFLFGVLRSSASLRGKQWGAAIDLGGPVVVGVLVVAGGYKFSQLPDTFTLTVRLDGPYAVEEMANGAKLWIDLNGRREHDDFGANAQLVVLEVPSTFLTDPIPVTFESNVFKAAGSGNSLRLKVPDNHVVVISVVKIRQAELKRARLARKYSDILDEVSLELSRKQAFLFPAIDRYVAHPTQDGWREVTAAARDSLQRIRQQMDEEVEYQSQQRLLDLVHETSATVDASGGLPRILPPPSPPSPPPFANAFAIHSQRSIALDQIPSGPLPDASAVRIWEGQIEGLYKKMETELKHLVAELRDQ